MPRWTARVEEARAAHAELAAALGAPARSTLRRPDRAALWQWRDRVPGAVTAMRGGKVSEDVVVPVERLARRSSASRSSPPATGCVPARGATGPTATCTPTCSLDPHNEADRAAAAAATEELFALAIELGGSICGEHGVGWLKSGQLARQWPEGALRLHEEIKRVFDPKGLLNPGKKLAR